MEKTTPDQLAEYVVSEMSWQEMHEALVSYVTQMYLNDPEIFQEDLKYEGLDDDAT